MPPSIDKEECVECGHCFNECPEDVFDIDDDGRVCVASPDNCVGCEQCVENCPEDAIVLE